MTLEQRKSLMEAISLAVAVSGVALALGALPALQGPARLFADAAFWPFDGAQSLAAPETRLFCGISGGVTAGFCILIREIARRFYLKDPAGARAAILTGVGAWFIFDSTGSILAGAPFNALINVFVAGLLAFPVFGGPRAPDR